MFNSLPTQLPASLTLRHLVCFLAVVVTLSVATELPRRRELTRLATACDQQRDSVQTLQRRLQGQQTSTVRLSGDVSDQVHRSHAGIAQVPRGVGPATVIETFADLLTLLQHHGVHCTSVATPDVGDQDANSDSGSVHCFTAIGSFNDVRTALQKIEQSLPQVAIEQLVLQRSVESEVCHWQLSFRFWEAMQ